MRTHLMAGTAFVAATMLAGGALAADKKMMKPSISVGGFHQQVISGIADRSQKRKWVNDAGGSPTMGSTNTDADTSAMDVRGNTEVHFNGKAVLDNGMTITARVALEGQSHTSAGKPTPANGNDQIDESWVAVSGSFGRIILGSDENAAVQMLIGYTGAWATNVGQNLQFNSDGWVSAAGGGHGGQFHVQRDARIREHGGGGDTEKLTYISPKLGGFQIGLSYIPDDEQDDNRLVDTTARRHDGFVGAASYSGKFGDVGFGGGVGYMNMKGAKDNNDSLGEDLTSWGAAGRVDFGGGFRVALGYEQTTSPMVLEGSVVSGGIRYVTGPNQFSVFGTHGEKDNAMGTLLASKYTAVNVGYNRVLGPGVSWHANLIYSDSESHTNTVTCNDGSTDPNPCASGSGLTANEEMYEDEHSGAVITTGITVRF